MTQRWGRIATWATYLAVYFIVLAGILSKPVVEGGDYWVHLAVVRALAHGQDVLSLPLGTSAQIMERHNDLFHNFWAAVVRLTDWSAVNVMVLAAIVNWTVFVCGVAYLATRLRRHWTLALCLLVFMMFAWGSGYVWSNEYYLSAMSLYACYPSVLAWGLSFFVLGLVHRWLVTGRPALLVTAIILGGLVAMVHPLTALMFTLSFPVLWVWFSRSSWRRRLLVLALPVGGVLLSLTWPHTNPVNQAEVVAGTWHVGSAMNPNASMFLWPERTLEALGPAWAGFLFLLWVGGVWRRRLLLGIGIYLFLWVGTSLAGMPLSHRFVFFMVFALHLAIALALARALTVWLDGRPLMKRAGPALLTAGAVLLIPWAPLQLFHVGMTCYERVDVRARQLLPSQMGLYEDACAQVAAELPPSSKILTDTHSADRLVAFGLPVEVHGGLQRDSLDVIGADVVALVRDRARQTGATHFLVPRTQLLDWELAYLASIGDVQTIDSEFTLVRLRPEGAR